MRKLLLSLVIVLGILPSVTLAQKKTVEHLKFLGIPICGTVENFEKQLEEKGFSRIRKSDFFQGYWDSDTVSVSLATNDRLNLVYGVNILTIGVPTYDKHKLKKFFDDYVIRFVDKYDSKSDDLDDQTVIPVYHNSKVIGLITLSYFDFKDLTYILIRYIDDEGLNKNQKENDKDL